MTERYVTPEDGQPEDGQRFSLYRLCECPECEGKGRGTYPMQIARWEIEYGESAALSGKCPECRGEGRIRQEVAGADSPEAVGLALVTLTREGEWEGCAFGLLDRTPECETCGGTGQIPRMQYERHPNDPEDVTPIGRKLDTCATCKGSGVKPTGTWLLLPWLPSARNVTDAARTLARSKKR